MQSQGVLFSWSWRVLIGEKLSDKLNQWRKQWRKQILWTMENHFLLSGPLLFCGYSLELEDCKTFQPIIFILMGVQLILHVWWNLNWHLTRLNRHLWYCRGAPILASRKGFLFRWLTNTRVHKEFIEYAAYECNLIELSTNLIINYHDIFSYHMLTMLHN